MGKFISKLVQPVPAVPRMPDRESKSYDTEIIVFTETHKLTNQDIREFKDANQQSYNLYKQHCAEAMLRKLTMLPEWDTVE